MRRRRPTTLPTSGWARRGDDENAPKCHKNGKEKRKPRRRTSEYYRIIANGEIRYYLPPTPIPNSLMLKYLIQVGRRMAGGGGGRRTKKQCNQTSKQKPTRRRYLCSSRDLPIIPPLYTKEKRHFFLASPQSLTLFQKRRKCIQSTWKQIQKRKRPNAVAKIKHPATRTPTR